MKPRVLMAGRTRYRAAARTGRSQRKFDALSRTARPARARGGAARGTGRRRDRSPCSAARPCPRSTGRVFYGSASRAHRARAAAAPAGRDPRAEPVRGAWPRSPARTLARSDAAVVVEIHGDWRTWSRLYGSPPVRARRPARRPRGARRRPPGRRGAHALAVHDRLVREARRGAGGGVPDLHGSRRVLASRPSSRSPSAPAALFVGVLERYKDIRCARRGLAARRPRVPEAHAADRR